MLFDSNDIISFDSISEQSKVIPDSLIIKREGFNIVDKSGKTLGVVATTTAIVTAIVSTAITITTSILDARRRKEVLEKAKSEEEKILPFKNFAISLVQVYNTELNTKRALLMRSGKLGKTISDIKNELSNSNLIGVIKNVGIIQDNRRESFLVKTQSLNGEDDPIKVFTGVIPKDSILLQFKQGVNYELEALNRKADVLEKNLSNDPNYKIALENSKNLSSKGKFTLWKRFYNGYYGELNNQFKLFRDRCKILGIELMEFGYNKYSAPHKKFGKIIPIFKNFIVNTAPMRGNKIATALQGKNGFFTIKVWLKFFYENDILLFRNLDGRLNEIYYFNLPKLYKMSNISKAKEFFSHTSELSDLGGSYKDTLYVISYKLESLQKQMTWAYQAGVPYWISRAYLKDVKIADYAIAQAEYDLKELEFQLLELKKQKRINLENPKLNDQADAQKGKENFKKSSESFFRIKNIFGKYVNLNSIKDFQKNTFAWFKDKKNKTKIIAGGAVLGLLAMRKK